MLRDRSDERLQIVNDEAVSIVREDGVEHVALAGGGRVAADVAVLSIGNLPPEAPRAVSRVPANVYIADPWSGDFIAGLEARDKVLLIGTGLTAIDVVLMLDAADFEGEVVALSRRGLVPRSHDRDPAPVPTMRDAPGDAGSGLLRQVRKMAGEIGWKAAVDQLRPFTQAIWARASVEQRRRFLRHLRPYWDVHRHRIAPQIAERIQRLEQQGRLCFAAGKLVSVEVQGAGARIIWRPRGSENAQEMAVRRIVNCTGPRGDVRQSGETLLESLVEAGRVRPDPCGIGIDIDEACRVVNADGEASESLYAIGPMTRGALWEIIAVPDLRVQTDALARALAA